MTTYNLLKLAHMAFVAISGSLFAYRFVRLNLYPDQPLARILKIAPHINDTLLLASALCLIALTGLNPLKIPWLTAKLVALLAYIALGAVCMHSRPRSSRQIFSFVGAAIVLFYIVSVALTKRVLPL